MKKQKSLSIMLATLVLCLLVGGCAVPLLEETDTTATQASGTLTDESLVSLSGAKFFPAEYTPEVILPEYDPQREVYFDCHGWDYDFYPNGSHSYVRFAILTKNEFSSEEIQVSLPLESGYTVQITQEVLFHRPEWLAYDQYVYGGMPFHVYQVYQETDWAELASLWLAAEEARLTIETKWPDGYVSNNPPAEAIPLEQVIAAYSTAMNASRETYYAMTEEDFPDYHCYIVVINFDLHNLVEESCHTATITIGDTTYTEEIGEIRIHTAYKPANDRSRGIEKYLYGAAFNQHDPWGGGLACGGGHHFETLDDVTLLGFRIEGMDAQVVGAQVSVSRNGYDSLSVLDDTYHSFKWNLATPLEITDGCGVQLDLVVSSPEWTKFEYGGFADIYLDYEVRGQQYSYCLSADMTRDRAPWETAAIVFDNLDIASYYTDYYIPCGETWRELIS